MIFCRTITWCFAGAILLSGCKTCESFLMRSGFHAKTTWAGRISGQMRSKRSNQGRHGSEGEDRFPINSIDVGFKHVDFPTIDDCERYLAAYVKVRPEDLAIGDNGVFVLVDCGKCRPDLMFIQIEMLAINGKQVPVELLKKYKQGVVEMLPSGQFMESAMKYSESNTRICSRLTPLTCKVSRRPLGLSKSVC